MLSDKGSEPQNGRCAFFCSYISFRNGSKLTQMLLLIVPILYSQSGISLGDLFKLTMTSGYTKAASTSGWLHARPPSAW